VVFRENSRSENRAEPKERAVFRQSPPSCFELLRILYCQDKEEKLLKTGLKSIDKNNGDRHMFFGDNNYQISVRVIYDIPAFS